MRKALVRIAKSRLIVAFGPLSMFAILQIIPPVSFADSSIVQTRTVTRVGEQIYVIRHKDAPDGFPQGNTTVIIGDREVLVVDSCYLPSSAREDIAQIRQWTNRPVRYLLDTHWHADHSRANGTYADAFPSVGIIAQRETRDSIKGFYADHPENAVAIVEKNVVAYRRYLSAGKLDNGTPLEEEDKRQLKAMVAGTESVIGEFKNLVPRLPTITFERELDLDLGNRDVQIKFLGRGNTAGDAVVYLPKEQILITGDLVVHPGPYMGSGYPTDWSKTLEIMIAMNPRVVIPGHGEVLNGATYLVPLNDLMRTVVAEVRTQYYRLTNRATLEEVKKAIDVDSIKKRFGSSFKDDAQNGAPYLDLDGLIKVAYEEIQPR